ncbi:dipeptide epimerase [Phenylobacterium sp. J426]|uniref:dipeptide epimerase n=1 Tax=Phenylobacterium sp. J426 TaxID=2898439 RepID=UPI00215124CC|nr:dipeptide epimerase [Phenylobacterium sp. J426]MCR5876180.1 dipeptide epimerase [Phenylobacterium sp. J426]
MTVAEEPVHLVEPFRITGYVFTEMPVVVVRLREEGAVGEGEASGVYYLGDDVPAMISAVEAALSEIEAGLDREGLRRLMPPCGGRNALDCALWDLEAKRRRQPVWKLAGLERPQSLVTTFTVGAAEPAVMAAKARAYAQARALKLKLTGEAELDAERVRAVRAARPETWIAVDANQGFDPDSLEVLTPALVEADVRLLEQPFARGREDHHDGLKCPIPIAADESVLSFDDIEPLVGRVQVINIKLDKCGGLTEGLAMAREAKRLGLGVMVGNMVGTSLAMGPAYLLGQLCEVVDLDGPIFITQDRLPSVSYVDGRISYPEHGWGSAP